MPVSHSHQLLWASLRLSTGAETSTGLLGSVTSKTSCPCVPFSRSGYVLPGTPWGGERPSRGRTVLARPTATGPAARQRSATGGTSRSRRKHLRRVRCDLLRRLVIVRLHRATPVHSTWRSSIVRRDAGAERGTRAWSVDGRSRARSRTAPQGSNVYRSRQKRPQEECGER